MKKLLVLLVAVLAGGVAWGVSPSAAQQQTCPPGQVGNFPYCQTPPLPAACGKFTSKLSLARATIDQIRRTISILAPITKLASGSASIQLHAAGLRTTFSAPVDSARGRIRVTHSVTRAQALLGTGILTFNYPGDADTRPQIVRLRAANVRAKLSGTRPTISPTGMLQQQGIVTIAAHGVVRTQLEYVDRVSGETTTLEFRSPIQGGKWLLNVQLPAAALAAIARRCGTVHSYTLFTGYLPRRIRGEMFNYQVLPSQ
jgi:hypothetical protein